MAVNAAESLHGRSLVRLEGLFYLNAKKRSCVVDAVTEVGRTISIIFTGFITDKFGEESFEVERDGTPECDSPSQYERLFKHLKDDLDNGV